MHRPFYLLRQFAAIATILFATSCDGQAARKAVKGGDGEFRVLTPMEPLSLDPNSARDEAALLLAPNLFNKLVTFDSDLQLLPDLATSWTASEGGRTYTFALRSGVRWHDGRPFTAEDVRWTFRKLAAQRTALAAAAFQRIDRIETPDELTVVLRLREPWAPFLPTLAAEGAYILPRPEGGEEPSGERPIGTGPFQFQEWVRRERIVLKANPRYFRHGPYVDRVIYRFLPGAGYSQRSGELLLAGEADHVVRSGMDLALRLSRDPRVQVRVSPSSARSFCAFNLRRASLRDVRVRQAINAAIDRHRFVDRALLGFGAPAFGFYTPAVAWAYNPKAHVPSFDPRHAEALLDGAGLPRGASGERFALELIAPNLPPLPEMAKELRDQLGEVGIGVRIVLLPPAAWLQRALRDHDFDLALMGGAQGPDPQNLSFRFSSRSSGQFMGYESAAFDAAVAEGARTVDLPRRAQAYFRAQEILARDLPIAPLSESVHIAVFRTGVRGLPQVEARGLAALYDYSLVRLAGGGS